VKNRKIDRCLAMWTIPSGLFTYFIKKFTGIPYDVWALGSDIWNRSKYPFGERLVKKILINAENRFADGIEFAKCVEKICGKKTKFLPTCRTLPINLKGKASVDEEKTNFLFIGRWEKEKGIDILIDATNLLSKEIKEIKLHVFGGGSLEKLIHEKIDKYNLKDFINVNGYANPETAVKYLRVCDCLIIPSRIESIPVVLSDALQMKKPVIVSNVGDMGKLVKKYRVGLVVKPENAEDLKDKMINFIKEDITKYQKNIDLLVNKFNIQKIVQKYINYV
ncbi:MAG: glycosyltransferase, partial [Actinobacteria bacterium]|nr:glycosyltransferase [Actinomycetota bacterium]